MYYHHNGHFAINIPMYLISINALAIAHFTVKDGNEAGVDLVLIQPCLLYYVNHVFVILNSIFLAKFTLEKEGGLYQNKVTLSLTFTQRQGHQAHNCKMAYYNYRI